MSAVQVSCGSGVYLRREWEVELATDRQVGLLEHAQYDVIQLTILSVWLNHRTCVTSQPTTHSYIWQTSTPLRMRNSQPLGKI